MAKGAQGLEAELASRGISSQRTEFPSEMFTVDDVARALNMKPSQIGKAMVVKISDGSYAIAMLGGDKRLSLAALSKCFKGKKVALATRRKIPVVTGLPVGAVTPLVALRRSGIHIVMDEGLLKESLINISNGDLHVGLNVSPRELARATQAIIGRITE